MNSKKILATLGTAAIAAGVMLPMLVGAQSVKPATFGIEYGTYTGLTQTDIRITIANIIRTAMGLLGIIAVVIVLYGGFKWMTAQGDTKAVDEAKKVLIAGIIGLVIIVSAYAIATFVINSLVAATTG
jgi:Zn-dependent protease with chaperone function